ncbi:MAG: hypothetical protein M3Y72_17555 [Acidobacteriota bacterium]|nr:hypothetical protein [Acidobacteriota bacterium]
MRSESDNAFGAGRQTGNSDFQLGQKIGDGVAFVQGGLQIIAGAGGDAGGGLVTATGIGAPVGISAIAVSTAFGLDGVSVAGTGADNLIAAASVNNDPPANTLGGGAIGEPNGPKQVNASAARSGTPREQRQMRTLRWPS